MRLYIISVGRERDAHVASLCNEYLKRLRWKADLILLDERKAVGAGNQKDREARLIRQAIPHGAHSVALDEKGMSLTSEDFARRIGQWEGEGIGNLAFIIGGADGLSFDLITSANFRLALGNMTWPHRLVRILILEQLYRAQTILSGHPYHRV